MIRVYGYVFLLLVGVALSQFPSIRSLHSITQALTMIFLAYIMVEVGLEFSLDKKNLKSYAKDYIVAMTAATLPWIFCAVYFLSVFSISPKEAWVISRFASPTSAGVLFTMLAAAQLSKTWVYKKARLLAIFDDFDTVILMIPLQMWLMGFSWQSLFIILVLGGLVFCAYKYLHKLELPIGKTAIFIYALILWSVCHLFQCMTKVHIEILLPAFCVGCIIHHKNPFHLEEKKKTFSFDFDYLIKGIFMLLVGISLPKIEIEGKWQIMVVHVLAITLLSNLGKCFPYFCYNKEATWKERLALCVALFPRGEVGAGILILSIVFNAHDLATKISGLSLTLNLVLTGLFILIVQKLVKNQLRKA